MSKCPHCGVEIQEGATTCWICQRRQIYQDDTWESRSRSLARRSAIGSFLLAIVIILAFGLFSYVLFEWNARLAGLFALFFSLLIGWLGTRGRYILPNLRQYLLTMLISLLPVLGTAYALFFTGSYLTEKRILRYLLYSCSILGVALLLSWKVYQGEYDLRGALSFFMSTETPVPTSTSPVTRTQPPTPSAIPPTSTVPVPTQPTATIENPALAGCLQWSTVTQEIVGQNVCVYGEYLSISQKQDNTYVMSFSDQPGTFQVWSFPKPFDPYLPKNGSLCVIIRGWMKTSGVRPIMILGAQGALEPCP